MNELERKEKALWKYSCAFDTERTLYAEREKIEAGLSDWFKADKAWRDARDRRKYLGDILVNLEIATRDELKNEEREICSSEI